MVSKRGRDPGRCYRLIPESRRAWAWRSRGRAPAGWGIVEVVVTVLVAAVLSLPILSVLTSGRTETVKAINYLRAMQLVQETLHQLQSISTDPTTLSKLVAESGSLTTGSGGSAAMVGYRVGTNPLWAAQLAKSLVYPDQYANCYYYREIEVTPIGAGGGDHGPYLYRATVTVSWNDSQVPGAVGSPDRARKVVQSILLCDERRGY